MHSNFFLSECVYKHFKYINILEMFSVRQLSFSDLLFASSRRGVTSGLTNFHLRMHEFSSYEAR